MLLAGVIVGAAFRGRPWLKKRETGGQGVPPLQNESYQWFIAGGAAECEADAEIAAGVD